MEGTNPFLSGLQGSLRLGRHNSMLATVRKGRKDRGTEGQTEGLAEGKDEAEDDDKG